MFLQSEWTRLTGDDVKGFDSHLLSEYGRLVHLEYPALLARMRVALAANVEFSGAEGVRCNAELGLETNQAGRKASANEGNAT